MAPVGISGDRSIFQREHSLTRGKNTLTLLCRNHVKVTISDKIHKFEIIKLYPIRVRCEKCQVSYHIAGNGRTRTHHRHAIAVAAASKHQVYSEIAVN